QQPDGHAGDPISGGKRNCPAGEYKDRRKGETATQGVHPSPVDSQQPFQAHGSDVNAKRGDIGERGTRLTTGNHSCFTKSDPLTGCPRWYHGAFGRGSPAVETGIL